MMPPFISVKVRQTTTPGTTCPTLYECAGSLTSHRFITCTRACETGPTVYRPYPRRLESYVFRSFNSLKAHVCLVVSLYADIVFCFFLKIDKQANKVGMEHEKNKKKDPFY